MAEVTGEFPKTTEMKEKKSRKKKVKKFKRRLRDMEYKLKYQKKIAKENCKRCKAEAELKFTKLLLQNHGSLPESFYTLHRRK